MKSFLLMLLSRGYVPESIERDMVYNPEKGCDELIGVITFKRYFNSPLHSAVFNPLAREDYNEAWELFHLYWRGMNLMNVR